MLLEATKMSWINLISHIEPIFQLIAVKLNDVFVEVNDDIVDKKYVEIIFLLIFYGIPNKNIGIWI